MERVGGAGGLRPEDSRWWASRQAVPQGEQSLKVSKASRWARHRSGRGLGAGKASRWEWPKLEAGGASRQVEP
ncbi:hypothetical protein KY284_000920 [Solanum tuberosum]|nr:hypothetical protein KY284_000920 [Solanum tuberosum]